MYISRFSSQVTQKNRITFAHEFQSRCEGSPLRTTTTNGCGNRGDDWVASSAVTSSPEASTNYIDFPYTQTQALWTNPLTNKILLEAGYSRLAYEHAGGPGQLPPDGIFDISVTEQSTAINPATGLRYAPQANYQYRALAQYADNKSWPMNWRASASYVTGSHSMKVGYQGAYFANQTNRLRNPSLLSYRFNQGVPNQFTMALNNWETADRTEVAAAFLQDTWTRGRLTMQGAVRYDRSWSYSPAEHNGTTDTSRLNATPITFDATASVDAFNDLTPRWGVAYDVFGNGKTAIKWNMGRYLVSATNDGRYTTNNPANRAVSTVDRGWTDTNGNKAVDCDLLNFGAQSPTTTGSGDVCAALTGNNLNFGRLGNATTTTDPALLNGWGVRPSDWQWGVTVQQELLPRVSMDVGYSRRWFHGVQVTDNVNRDPSQYVAYTLIAPQDSRLADGGGYPITLYVPTNAAAAVAAQNLIRAETDFGPERKNYYDGVDLALNARLRQGLTLQVGSTTGRSVTDRCDTMALIDSPDLRDCRNANPFLTTVRGLASYTVPKIDVLISGTVRSQPRQARTATWNVPNSVIIGLLGFTPSNFTATGTQAIGIDDNDHRIWDESRRTQIDMRFAKIVRFGRTRTDIGVDVTNLLNSNYATAWDNTYQYDAPNGGTWNNPTTVFTPRFVRLNFTVNF